MDRTPPLTMSSILAYSKVLSIEDASTLNYLKYNDPSYSHFDWDGAEKWNRFLAYQENTTDIRLICRTICYQFITCNDVMLDLARRGRELLVSNLTDNELQVFRNAGLLSTTPDNDLIQWWDRLKKLAKMKIDEKLLAQGRLAESWTLEVEKKIIAEFCDFSPEYVAIDSDNYGYDILSYRQDNTGNIFNVHIEVKSYGSKYYPHIYLTSNEWNNAKKPPYSCIFYIWCIENKEFSILSVKDMERHIAKNNGQGIWQSLLINL